MTFQPQASMNWELESFFPIGDVTSSAHAFEVLHAELDSLLLELKENHTIEEDSLETWCKPFLSYEYLEQLQMHTWIYFGCKNSADTSDEDVKTKLNELDVLASKLEQVEAFLKLATASCSDELFETFLQQKELQQAGYFLRRWRFGASKLMSSEKEMLASELGVNGINAWGQLYTNLQGSLTFELKHEDGRVEEFPMSHKLSLLNDENPSIRKAALEGSNKAWEEVSQVNASCLNAIAGSRLTLYKHRGIEHFLEPPVFRGGITTKTLEAMMEAIAENYELPREYLRMKAKALGVEKVGFQDIFCPLPLSFSQKVTWGDAQEKIVHAFSSFDPELANYSKICFEHQWIEAEPRANKASGGYCAGSHLLQESRIYMTFNDTLGDVQTLAHELGHGFHNWLMKDLRSYARIYPYTLAETASILAETVYTDAVLNQENIDTETALSVLNTRLEGAVAFMLDIPMRFMFEKRFYEERAQGTLSVSRFKELLLEAQLEAFGDSLHPEQLDPYFWCSKLHFYISSLSFYNFPYAFGYLFSLGVYAKAKKEGKDFIPKLHQLLRETGTYTAEEIALRNLGVDLESKEFWQSSIDLVKEDFVRFQELFPKVFPS